METYDCSLQLSYSLEGVSTYYKPDDPLTTGTATLSNNPGSVMTPASGHIFSYTNGGDGTIYTITAARDKGGSDSKSDSDKSDGSSNPTRSSTGESSKATGSSKNGAKALAIESLLVLGAVLVSALVIV